MRVESRREIHHCPKVPQRTLDRKENEDTTLRQLRAHQSTRHNLRPACMSDSPPLPLPICISPLLPMGGGTKIAAKLAIRWQDRLREMKQVQETKGNSGGKAIETPRAKSAQTEPAFPRQIPLAPRFRVRNGGRARLKKCRTRESQLRDTKNNKQTAGEEENNKEVIESSTTKTKQKQKSTISGQVFSKVEASFRTTARCA